HQRAWQHILDGHPQLRGRLEEFWPTIRLGDRQQPPRDSQTYVYWRLCTTLQSPFNRIIMSVAFRFAETEAGVTIANTFVVTAWGMVMRR
ncbi:MAG TPA: hypothetical protein PKE45_15795, partial [Caldilineaceae bacterium]|nr:hypothetical protein [Caldilineaceae bacterium]